MVDLRVIIHLVEIILCILYNGVVLIVIPDCTEAITFNTKVVTATHIGVEEQIQSLKSVVVHVLLAVVIISITLLKFWIRTGVDLLCKGESCLCSRCQEEERERDFKRAADF